MSITTVGSQLIHYEALGRGEPVIFIHGWLGSWRYWWNSMQALSTHYRTFAFDLWGFGDSSKTAAQYTLDGYAQMVADFVDRLGIMQPVTLVGHTLGAAVALRYATQTPAAVKRLAAVALPIQGAYVDDRLSEGDADTFLARALGRQHTHPEVEAELRKTDARALQETLRELAGVNFVAELDALTCPLLLVYGADDQVVQQPSGDYYHLQKPGDNRAYVALASSNHFPMLDEKAKFNRLLLEFLRTEDDLRSLSPKEYWQRRTH